METRKMDQEAKELIFPEAHETIDSILRYLDEKPKRTTTNYGHALGMLAQVAYSNCESLSFEDQKKKLREAADYLVKRYGVNIAKFMKPELREALGYSQSENGQHGNWNQDVVMIEIPTGVAPDVRQAIIPIVDEINAGGLVVDTSGSDESMYGHALRNLVQSAFDKEGRSKEEQMELLKRQAQALVNVYGPRIVEKMRPELREALGIASAKAPVAE